MNGGRRERPAGRRYQQRQRFRPRTTGARAAVVAVLLMCAAPAFAQQYELLGSVETRAMAAYRKDSPVVADQDLRGTWYGTTLARIAATHRLTLGDGSGSVASPAELLIDHALTILPVSATDGSGSSILDSLGVDAASSDGATGTAGTGSAAATGVLVSHELYQAYVSVYPADSLTFRFGRQRLNWGHGWTFSVSDALHPQSPDSEVEPGFDGASVAIYPSANLSLEGAVAVQDAVASGDLEDIRTAGYLNAYLAPVDVALSVVHEYATMLRPGVGFSVPVGPLLLAGEGAVEAYDPRGEVLNAQPLASIGGEYTWYGDVTDVVLMGEYIYNGLEETYPGITAPDLAVTSDAAGGFQRPGRHYLSASASLAVTQSWSTEHSILVNMSDQSFLVRHDVTLQRIPAVDLSATVTWNAGEASSEFGMLQEGMVVELGATAHF